MKRRHVVWPFALAVGFAGVGVDLDRPVLAQKVGTLVMVTNKSNTSASAVSKSDARKLLLGQTSSWPGGGKVVVVLRPQRSAERAAVLQKVCGMSEAEYTRFQLQVMFTGRPATVAHEESSEAGVKSFVKSNPGAVGFVYDTEVDKDLKVVLKLE